MGAGKPQREAGALPRAPAFRFDPCDFAQLADEPEAEAYTKRTCLWGSFIHPEPAALPPLLGSKMHRMPDTKERANKRSATPLGFARAFHMANRAEVELRALAAVSS